MPAGHADAPGDDHGDLQVTSGPLRLDRPIRLADVERIMAGSADVEHLDHDTLRTWRAALTVVLEALTYARAILAADVAILRRAGAAAGAGTPSAVDDLVAHVAADHVRDQGDEPEGEPDDAAIDEGLFVRTDELLSAHQEMAVVDLSSAFDVAGSLAVVEEQLAALTERQEAVEARLAQIRAAVIRRYEEGEASAREQPA